MATTGRIAVFAYGSLVSPLSAAGTLGRAPQERWRGEQASFASLVAWRRRFSQARDNRTCEKTFALDRDGSIPDVVLGLNVERTGDREDLVTGVAIAVSEEELLRLDRRELRYDRLEVRDDVHGLEEVAGFDRVYTYVAKAAHFASEPPGGAVILRSYVRAVEGAFSLFGPEQVAAYRNSTGPPPVELVDAHLVHDRIPPGNPREW